jgi:hypothetical protein
MACGGEDARLRDTRRAREPDVHWDRRRRRFSLWVLAAAVALAVAYATKRILVGE